MQIQTILPSGVEVRQKARVNEMNGQTAGQAPDHLQGNVVILPQKYAADFLQFCLNNPKPCPLIGLSKPGETTIPLLGKDLDLRSDIPSYRIFQKGQQVRDTDNISSIWTDDLVTFVLGCSFTFEEALIRNGYPVHHVLCGTNVPMFNTNIETIAAGVFSGPMVVTMRSFQKDKIPAIFDLCTQYPHAHGTPIFWGNPEKIGIKDIQNPDYGDPVEVPDDEIPVFWPCGVTTQAAINRAKPDLCITHAPGCMLVTDLPSSAAPKPEISMSHFWPVEAR